MKWSEITPLEAERQGRELLSTIVGTIISGPAGDAAPDGDRLRTATRLLRRAVAGLDSPSRTHAAALGNLAICNHLQYKRTQTSAALNLAIDFTREAIAESEIVDHDTQYLRGNLGGFIFERFKAHGDPADFTVAVSELRQAIVANPDRPNQAHFIGNLRVALNWQLEKVYRLSDFRLALALCRYQALLAKHNGEEVPFDSVLNYSNLLYRRSQETRRPDDTLQFIHSSLAAAKANVDHPQAFVLVGAAAQAGLFAYPQFGSLGILTAAKVAAELAVELATSEADKDKVKSTLSLITLRHHEATGTGCTGGANCDYRLVASYFCGKAAREPQDQAAKLHAGLALEYAYQHGHRELDVSAAYDILKEALDSIAQNDPDRHRFLTNLGTVLRDRYLFTHDLKDLTDGIAMHEAAATSCPDNLPDKSHHLQNLGLGLAELYRTKPSEGLAQNVAGAYRQAAYFANQQSQSTVLNVVTNWSRWAEKYERWEDVVESGRVGLSAARSLLRNQSAREHKEVWLLHAQDLSASVAYALVHKAYVQPDDALAELEQGRVQLLAERFSSESTTLMQGLHAARVAAKTIPIVYLATTWAGGIALVLDGDSDVPRVVPLVDCGMKTVDARVEDYLRVIWAFAARQKTSNELSAEIDSITGWLHDAVMGPLLDALQHAPAACLIPTGPLGLVPLHAAWTADPECIGGRRYVDDSIIISYAPSAVALNAAHNSAANESNDDVLLVTEPSTEGAEPLPWARREGLNVESLVRERGGVVHPLQGKEVQLTAFEHLLGHAGVLHFAGHAVAEPLNPLRSRLCLADRQTLTVGRMLHQSGELRKLRLAVLSACDTGQVGTRLLNECVGLPSALMASGTAGIVASFWPVNDRATEMLISKFYEFWYRRHETPATALASARTWLRTSTNASGKQAFPEEWPDQPPGWSAQEWLQLRPFARKSVFWASFSLTGV